MTQAALNLSSTPLEIAGYSHLQQIYQGSRTMVYRAVQMATQRPVVIKLLRQEHPSVSDLVQFRNQYTIAANLPIAGIVQPLGLIPWGNSEVLVMEDWGGVALSDYIKCHKTLTTVEVLPIALQLADILHDLSRHRVVHKDIKPANILIQPETQQIKLIDFSIASLLPKETQQIQNPHALEGTLAYLAPEQTGRMNRGIDYRADFYALGVTLYQLLTGSLPFQSDDPLELVHCHIAKAALPVDQANPEIPVMVARIVAKLMAKNAEDRYQSGLGLKHDLQECLDQWQEKQTIALFELGQADISDRFLIPEKLYGRESEVQTLLEAFDRVAVGSSELMLVAGFSGIGKTAVVNEVHKPIIRQRGYFIKGKYDQFNRDIPLSAFVQALRDLIKQLLSESDRQLQQWKTQILAALGENGQVLIEVIPELEQVIGKQPPVLELSGSATQNRFNLLFQKFIQVFTTAEHPLVIFLDDLQWADSASLQLLQLLMNDNRYLLMLGAYRDNEVSPTHPFMLKLEDLKKSAVIVNTIAIKPLAFADTNHLIADTLNCSPELAQPLTELITRKTQGNPFFTTQFLETLHEEGYITFDGIGEASQNQNQRYWQCDITKVNALSLTDDVVEFMALQLQKLPDATQQVLKLAACIGNQFDLNTLAIVSEQSLPDAASALWKALQEGLILPTSQVYKFFQQGQTTEATTNANASYRFLHDRVQQAAYSLTPDAERANVHFKIGQLLLQQMPLAIREEHIFELVNHLNYGIAELVDRTERDNLAHLNGLACRKARAATAYPVAHHYAEIGLQWLGADAWQRQKQLTLTLHDLGAEVAWVCSEPERMEQWIDTVLQADTTPLEQVTVYQTRIQALISQNQLSAAIVVGQQILKQLGLDLADQPTAADIQQEIEEINHLIGDRTILQLSDLPKMTDPLQLAILQIIFSVLPACQITNSPLFPLISALVVKLSIQFGNSPSSGSGYLIYGLVLNNLFQSVDQAMQFGQLGYRLADTAESKNCRAMILVTFSIWMHHRKTHLRETLEVLQAGYQAGIETGALDQAGYSGHVFCWYVFWCGLPLMEIEPQIQDYRQQLINFNQLNTADYCLIYLEAVVRLLDPNKDRALCQQETLVAQKLAAQDISWVALFHLHQFTISFLFGDLTEAEQHAAQFRVYLPICISTVGEAVFYFYDSLVSLAQSAVKAGNTATIEPLVQANQQLLRLWADHAPMNYLHKWQLVEAEHCRVLGRTAEAIDLYDLAIAGAKANSYIQEEALANELAAKFYLAWGKAKVAAGYMQEAYDCYIHWGAKAKVNQLEHRYPELLRPILAKAQSLHPPETFATIASGQAETVSASDFSIRTSAQTSRSSSSANATLDFIAILKASQSLSRTIKLDDLLHQLTQIILQNSGADRCALILPNTQKEWEVRAIATPKDTQLFKIPLQDNLDVPTKLIYYVKNTQEIVIIDDCKTDLPVIGDYLNQHRPKSILCLPILSQGQLIGILYLKNRLTRGVFTYKRVETLQLLTSQAAIALENAQLYQQVAAHSQTLEAEVERKTQALNQQNQALQKALQQIQQTQTQLVHAEKMSSLGQMVAGIAHEINNPVSFIRGNLEYTQSYFDNLVSLLTLYQQEYPQPSSTISAKCAEIDLDFLMSDLSKILGSMDTGSDRIHQIVLSLRSFARLDEAGLKTVDLHEGIESTLLIVQHRCQASAQQAAIQVVKDYGTIPAVTCYPSQLNQVFLHILNNAIDAIRENLSFDRPPKIQIRTLVNDLGEIQIQITNTHSFIPEEIQTQIFNPFFTTKPIGQGAGLGLSISYTIIQQHQGTLTVQSHPTVGTEFRITIAHTVNPVVG